MSKATMRRKLERSCVLSLSFALIITVTITLLALMVQSYGWIMTWLANGAYISPYAWAAMAILVVSTLSGFLYGMRKED